MSGPHKCPECGVWWSWPSVHSCAGVITVNTTNTTLPRPTPAGYPRVQGSCPTCGRHSLFLGDGGYVTCGHLDCSNPTAATEALA